MKNTIKIITITAFVVLFSASFNKALAEPLIDKSDTMSRIGNSSTENVYSDHTIQLTTPSGVASGETIVITFPSDFDGTTHPNGTLDFSDVDMFIDSSTAGTCSLNPQTLVASGPTESQWGAAFSGTESRVLTLTSGGASAVVSAGAQVCIKIGQNATGGTANSQYANPTASQTYIISIEAGPDSGDLSVSIIDSDKVTITAEVSETITFSIADYEIGFGVLNSSTAVFATGLDPYGSFSPVSAHTMSVATNGSTGYEITYLGPTLTNQNNDTIEAATISSSMFGLIGTEQFALSFTISDDANIYSAYDHTVPNYNFVPNITTPFVYEDGPTITETISAFYLANISGVTPAGSYSTSLTYVATANF